MEPQGSIKTYRREVEDEHRFHEKYSLVKRDIACPPLFYGAAFGNQKVFISSHPKIFVLSSISSLASKNQKMMGNT